MSQSLVLCLRNAFDITIKQTIKMYYRLQQLELQFILQMEWCITHHIRAQYIETTIKLQWDMFLKKVPKPYTYTFKWHQYELTSTLLFCPQDVHTKIELFTIKSFPLKHVRLSRYVQNVWKINGKEIEYHWVKENLIVP